MVLGLLSRSLSFSRSFWLFGDRASSSFFSLLKRSRPVRRMCCSILRCRFMSDSTLSSRASLFTDERAEDPERGKNVNWTSSKQSLLLRFQNWIKPVTENLSEDETPFFNLAYISKNLVIACHTWCSASVDEGIFRSGLHLLFIKVKLSWTWRPVRRKKKKKYWRPQTQIKILYP